VYKSVFMRERGKARRERRSRQKRGIRKAALKPRSAGTQRGPLVAVLCALGGFDLHHRMLS
jgi:hypothetical protein